MTRCAILCTGDELITGRVRDENGGYLARELTAAGLRVAAVEWVGDAEEEIASRILALARGVDCLVVSGGLGPTPDDATRQALARAAGLDLLEDPALVAGTGARRRMALVPRGASTFPNPAGAAAGLLVQVGSARVYALSGFPEELRATWRDGGVLADIRAAFPNLRPPQTRLLKIFGAWEADLVEELGGLLEEGTSITARDGVITLQVTGPGAQERAREIRAIAGLRLFAEAEETLAVAAVKLLTGRGATLATAESLTGGLLAGALVGVPGASQVYRGGFVAYSAAAKESLLEVESALLKRCGAVSGEVARAMAGGARARLRSDFALATTGVAGPDSDERGTPVGSGFVALASPGGEEVLACGFSGDRDAVRRRFVNAALDLLRRRLSKKKPEA